MVNIWKRDSGIASFDEGGDDSQARLRFFQELSEEALTEARSFVARTTVRDVVDAITAQLDSHEPVASIEGRRVHLTGVFQKHPVLISLYDQERSGSQWNDVPGAYDDGYEYREVDSPVLRMQVEITGHREAIDGIMRGLSERFKDIKIAVIKWWSAGSSGPQCTSSYLDQLKTNIPGEFYPDLGNDPAEYLKGFLDSKSAILLVAGPPGTGKTTLLRHLICDFNLAAHVVYDESLMKNDRVFQTFLFEKDSDVLIIEDADTVLTSREAGDNKLMARFLNVSDGLIKLPDKKVVFTTNISDFGRVDPALLRPGRCFDVLHTRAMNLIEAQAAAKVAGLPIPTEKREYTLAELFNQRQGGSVPRRVGFTGRN